MIEVLHNVCTFIQVNLKPLLLDAKYKLYGAKYKFKIHMEIFSHSVVKLPQLDAGEGGAQPPPRKGQYLEKPHLISLLPFCKKDIIL